jgi:hypothetical protein
MGSTVLIAYSLSFVVHSIQDVDGRSQNCET